MFKLEIAQQFYELITKKDFSRQQMESYFTENFFLLNKKEKSKFLYALFNGLMSYDIRPQIIIDMYNILMRLDSYRRDEQPIATKNDNTCILECTGSGKKPYKTLNISTPSIITAVASGANIIKKGSGTTSSILGSADLLYEMGLQDNMSNDDQLYLLNNTGFSFVDIEKVIPNFNSIYNGFFYRPHILSYILAADVTSLRGTKILYGLSCADIMKCCRCLCYKNTDCEVTVYNSTENKIDFFDELIGNGIAYVARKNVNSQLPTISQYKLNTAPATSLKAMTDRVASIQAVLELLKTRSNKFYCDVVCYNAGFYLFESGVVNNILDGVELAKDTLLSGKSYKKLIEIIKCSGGRPKWNE